MKKGFTLAEVLITLAIIGVVAAVSIPSVISNSNQQQYRTGLRKAVSVLNSAITMNMALEGETPYDNANLFGYLMKHMSVMYSTTDIRGKFFIKAPTASGGAANSAFYTTDGMRFELRNGQSDLNMKLYESNVRICTKALTGDYTIDTTAACGGCGSYGLKNNPYDTTKPPCLVTVDVNGDRKPNPANVNCKKAECAEYYKYADPKGIRLSDIFSIMITDKEAIPYGTASQKAMYQAQSKNKN